MLIQLSTPALKQTWWYEYALRVLLGGLATVVAGAIGAGFGPDVGGLFLSLPVIFCASATLIESHASRSKEKAGLPGRRRGQTIAALDAAGAGLGAMGLAAFALAFHLSVETSIAGAFANAIIAWAVVAVSAWSLRRKLRSLSPRPRAHRPSTPNRGVAA